MQAMHDILYHRTDISKYDHLEFPGVVPRTFLGPLFISFIATPGAYIGKTLGYSKFLTQYIVRGCLGIVVLLSFQHFLRAIKLKLGNSVATWTCLLTMTQFHFLFYATRPLPNTFALALTLNAIGDWLRGRHSRFIWFSALAIIVFRSELSILMGLLLLYEIFSCRLTVGRTLLLSGFAGIVCISATVVVDSSFWQRFLWPEGEVFWFNTVQNKSSQWGTSPFLWYFYSALPRALGASLLFIPLGAYLDSKTRPLLTSALIFILVYSILPHKELRFIVYTVPVLSAVAATGCNRLWMSRNKSWWRKLLALATVLHLVINCVTTLGFLYISRLNYPGGYCLQQLHQLEATNRDVNVHIDVMTAQTGVTRFTQIYDHWRYNKTEDLTPGGTEMNQFTHLLIGVSSSGERELEPYRLTHTIVTTVNGFTRLKLTPKAYPFVEILTDPKIYLLKRISV